MLNLEVAKIFLNPKNSFSQFVLVMWLVSTSLWFSVVEAKEGARWSMSTVLGGHLPALRGLSDGLYGSDLIGKGNILIYEGQDTGGGLAGDDEEVDENVTELRDFRFSNPLPEVGVGPVAGLEFQWHPNDRHSLILGIGSFESTSIGRVSGNLPMQQYFVSNEVNSERRAKISYTEYTLGWGYTLWRNSKFRLYSRLAIHEVFDIDFRDDFVFLFVDSPIVDLIGVRRVMVVEAQTASMFMGQLGIGGEWFLRDWLSLGFEGGYLLGERKFQLRNVTTKDDFLAGDNVRRDGMPYAELADGSLGYLRYDAVPDDVADQDTRLNAYEPMNLSFDGWRVVFRVNFYY